MSLKRMSLGRVDIGSMSRSRVVLSVAMSVVSIISVVSSCVPANGSAGRGVSPVTSAVPPPGSPYLSALQLSCMAGQHLAGLAINRPPTLDEIARVITAARVCSFSPPRGYENQYAEHASGAPPIPPLPAGPSPSPTLTGAIIKCIADLHLDWIPVDRLPSADERVRLGGAAVTCGFAIPLGFSE